MTRSLIHCGTAALRHGSHQTISQTSLFIDLTRPSRLHEAHGSARGGRAEDSLTLCSLDPFSVPISPCAVSLAWRRLGTSQTGACRRLMSRHHGRVF